MKLLNKIVFFGILLLTQSLFSQITTAQTSINNYVSTICGQGITYSNISLTGSPDAIARFTDGLTAGLGSQMNSGIVMSTGFVNTPNALHGPVSTFKSGVTNGPSIPELNSIANATTYDGIILEFDFVPITSQIAVNYQFGSEEYNEFVNTQYNDAFAFYISGPGIAGNQNIAVLPGTNIPVTINTINAGQATSGWGNNGCGQGCTNCSYYNDNCQGQYNNCMDGFTTMLTASATVIPCQVYHIKLMIADGGDRQYDSWVFLQESGLFATGDPIVSVDASSIMGSGILPEGCSNTGINFSIPNPLTYNYNINVTYSGTATMGVDYSNLPNTVTIPAGQTSVNVPINVFADGITEGVELIIIDYPMSVCQDGQFIIQIIDADSLLVNAGSDITFCEIGETATISANATGGIGDITYTWSGGSSSTNSSINVSPSSTTTYIITVQDECGSVAMDTVVVSLGQKPAINAGNDISICQGASATLTASGSGGGGGISYSWNQGLGNGASKTVSPNNTTTYVVTGVSANGCQNTDTITVTVNPLPTVTTSGNVSICQGDAVTISGFGASTFNWNQGLGAGASHSVSPNSTITYTVTGMDGNGCTNTATVKVTVNPTPSFTVNVNQPTCGNSDGQIVLVGLSSSTNYTVSYDFNGVTVGPIAKTSNSNGQIILGNLGQGTYTNITVTTDKGCSTTISVPTQLSEPNPPTITMPNSVSACIGDTVVLNASASSGASVSWNNGVTNGVGFVVNSVGNTTYTVTATLASCSSSQQVVVTVHDLPVVDAGVNFEVCQGDTITLNGNGANSYTWNHNVINGTPFVINSTTTFTVVGVNANGCENTDNIKVTVNPTPNFSVNTIDPTCGNSDGQIIISGLNPSTSYDLDYIFGGSALGTTAVTTNAAGEIVLDNLAAGSYTDIEIITEKGCSKIISIPTQLNAPNPPTVTAPTDMDICIGDQVTLTAGNLDGAIISWDNGISDGVSFTPDSVGTTTYTVTGTIANCTDTAQVVVTVHDLPTVDAGVDFAVCYGDSITLNGSGANSYSWNHNVVDGSAFEITNTTTFTMTGTDSWGCENTDNITVTVLPLPNFSLDKINPTCENDNGKIIVTDLGISTNYDITYSNNGTIIGTDNITSNSAGEYVISDLLPGVYQVSITDSNGCVAYLEETLVNIPSPIIDDYTIVDPLCHGYCDGEISAIVSGGTGNISYQWFTSDSTLIGNSNGITDLCDGSYFVQITDENNCIVFGSTTVTEPPAADSTFTIADFCENETNEVSDIASPGGIFSFNPPINDGAIIDSITGVISNPIAGTTYTVQYETPNGCSRLTQNVYVHYAPNVSFVSDTLMGDFPLPVNFENTSTSQDATTYSWDFRDGNTEENNDIIVPHTFETNGDFEVMLVGMTENGCSDTAIVKIVVLIPDMSYKFPNVFTPNGDNENDLFHLVSHDNIKHLEILILNRWGNVIYESDEVDFKWDGTIQNNGIICKDGTYFYKATITDLKGETVKEHGFVHLIRKL